MQVASTTLPFDSLSAGPSTPTLSFSVFLRLPDEIKIKILKEVLPVDCHFSATDFSSAQHRINVLL
jgi:hypothetical protein